MKSAVTACQAKFWQDHDKHQCVSKSHISGPGQSTSESQQPGLLSEGAAYSTTMQQCLLIFSPPPPPPLPKHTRLARQQLQSRMQYQHLPGGQCTVSCECYRTARCACPACRISSRSHGSTLSLAILAISCPTKSSISSTGTRGCRKPSASWSAPLGDGALRAPWHSCAKAGMALTQTSLATGGSNATLLGWQGLKCRGPTSWCSTYASTCAASRGTCATSVRTQTCGTTHTALTSPAVTFEAFFQYQPRDLRAASGGVPGAVMCRYCTLMCLTVWIVVYSCVTPRCDIYCGIIACPCAPDSVT